MSAASLKASEPSMEEILASIRRIISDDQETMRTPEPEETVPSPLKNVLDIAERHAAPIVIPARDDAEAKAVPESFAMEDVISSIVSGYEREQAAPARPSRAAARPAPASQPDRDAPLLSGQADATIAEAFGRLDAVLLPREPRTVEDLMKEMLRPMLKAWLDDNLPGIVERLVQAEIQRVARGR
jgi:uncharacterized protein